MDLKFFPIESRIRDFIEFPKLIYAYNEYMKNEDDLLQYINTKEFLDMIQHGENLLKPYEKDIEKFYIKPIWFRSDFPYLILNSNSIFGYEHEEDFLNSLLSLDEYQIKQSIIYSILSDDDKFKHTDKEIMNNAMVLSKNNGDMMAFIKDLPIDAADKWNIYLIIEDPINYMKMYVELMFTLLPIYQNFYRDLEDSVNYYGQSLVDVLNKQGVTGLKDITFDFVDNSMLSDETNNILISVIHAYSILLGSSDDIPYFIWGNKVEDAFKAMKEKNENKLNERVLIFKNLGDKTRYEVVKLIAAGESSTKKIATTLEVSSATISYHLNALVNAKIIKLDKSNNKFAYIIDWDFIESAFNDLKADLCIKN